MRRSQHLRAILILPGTVTLIVPAALCLFMPEIPLWHGFGSCHPRLLVALGGFLFGLGLMVMVTTIVQFAHIGHGTLAPWAPPQRLVVQGIYRYVRNPMISGVFCILMGEAFILNALPLLGWFGLFFTAKLIYIPLHEEPHLRWRFGSDYQRYQEQVPRWLPRMPPAPLTHMIKK